MSTTPASLLLWALVPGLVASTAAAVPKNAAQTIAYSPETHPVLFYDFPVVAGQEYLVATFDLKPVTTTTLTPSATTAPDTVIYVLNKGALTVVASDDDGNTDPSQATQLHAYGGVSGDPYEPFAASCLPAGICNTDWN